MTLQSAQFTAQQVVAVVRRRRKLVILPAAIVTCLCLLGALILPRKYESSSTILVQKDEILNPLVSYTMAVTMASEDRLKTFNEIIYSQTTIQILIESLKLAGKRKSFTEEERQEMVKKVRKDISTDRPGSSSFKISYLDTDPVRAQRAVLILSNHFIKTILQVENQRNELAVQFFETKLVELRERFEESQQEVIVSMRKRIEDMPAEGRALQSQIEETEEELRDIDGRLKLYQQGLTMIKRYPQILSSDEGKKVVYDLARTNLPYAADLRPLLTKYDDYIRRYTERYPEVTKLKIQILDLLSLIRSSLESETSKERAARLDVEARRIQLVEDLKRTSVSKRVDEDMESTHDIYRKLYDEMKVKLEQARTNRDLGLTGREQFIIIDPPLIPSEPSKPNRMLIIFGGIGVGIFLGLLIAGTAELLDTRVRTKKDVEVYQKPVIAFIPDAGFIVR